MVSKIGMLDLGVAAELTDVVFVQKSHIFHYFVDTYTSMRL